MQAPPTQPSDQRRLIFQVGDALHEIHADLVLEVMKVPHITRVPGGPEALAGIVNLRGRPLPVLSMSRLLKQHDPAGRPEGRIIVYDHNEPVGLLVDGVHRLSADISGAPLQGLNHLLDAAFKVAPRPPIERAPATHQKDVGQSVKITALLTFRVSDQLYGLPLGHVLEIATVTEPPTAVPNAAAEVVGLVRRRGGVFPLISLEALLGLSPTHRNNRRARIVVLDHDGEVVGLIVDEVEAIHRLPESAIEPVPSLLQKGRGDAQIDAIGRTANGSSLISILSPEKLFGHQAVVQAISLHTGANEMETTSGKDEAHEQFLIFHIGDEAYGLPIAFVDEVIRVPEDVTRVPNAPPFVMGLINLRGKAIPLVDQRSRFDADDSVHATKARAIIVTLGDLQAGFVVDGASEVKRVAASALSVAPEFSSDRTEVFDRIAHIESEGRMILLVDPTELLTRAEQDVVAAITSEETLVVDP